MLEEAFMVGFVELALNEVDVKGHKCKKSHFSVRLFGGMDGTRTRDLLRDRQAF
jgi:hypothetical protein